MTIASIIAPLEAFAPPALQESYDNTGFQVGDPMAEATGVLICVDATEEILDEAAERGCNLVVTHHPLLFRAVKQVLGRNRPERVLAKAIRLGITIYSCHTSVDSTPGGVSWRMAEALGLKDVELLAPASAGSEAGLGVVGNLPEALSPLEFASAVKKAFGSEMIRMSRPPAAIREISRVALCGGAGSEFLPEAIGHGAQVLVTADCKHNTFLDYASDIILMDAGHFETELCTKKIFFDILTEKFPNFAVYYSDIEQNPIIYL